MIQEEVLLHQTHSVKSSAVKFGNDGILAASHIGNLKTADVVLTDVLKVPGITKNLISKGRLDEKGCSISSIVVPFGRP